MLQKKFFFHFIVLALVFFSLFFHISCKKYDNIKEIREVDTLIKWTKTAKEMMIIDNESIRKRTDSIRIKLTAIDSSRIKIQNEETLFELKQYRGIMYKYIEFLENYQALEFDNIAYTENLDSLKKLIIDKKIEQTQAAEIIASKKIIIRNHLNNTQALVQSVLGIEEMYKRINTKVNILYANISGNKNSNRN